VAKATYELMVDWDGYGTYGGSADVSARTFNVYWRRGRDYASQLAARSRAGIMEAQIDNRSGDYSPFNAASPLYGNTLPGRLVRLRGTADGTVFDLWRGHLERLSPSPSVREINTVDLRAIGPLGYLNQRKVTTTILVDTPTGSAIDEIADEAGWPSADRVIDAGQTTMTRFWVTDTQVMAAFREVEETESGFIVETKAGKVAFEDRHHRLASPHTVSQGTFTDGGGTLFYSGIQQADALDSIFNVFVTNVQAYTTADLATLSVLVGPSAGIIATRIYIGGTYAVTAVYPAPSSPSNAIGVAAWTTPVSTTDYNCVDITGDTIGTTNMNSELSVAATKYSTKMGLVVTNVSGTTDVWLTKLEARGNALLQDDPAEVSVEDTASQGKYGQRSYPNPADFVPDVGEAEDWGEFNLSIYKDPVPVLAISIPVNRDMAHLKQALARDISDRITIVGTGSAGLGVAEDFFIEAEAHEIDRNRTHLITWECSQATRSGDFWVLDESALGTQTRLSY